jgi:hypothetical protein
MMFRRRRGDILHPQPPYAPIYARIGPRLGSPFVLVLVLETAQRGRKEPVEDEDENENEDESRDEKE